MGSESGPLTKFTLFPQLPIELRYKIWDATMEGRIVEVVYNEDDDFYYTEAVMPTALSLCQESRCQALLHYDLLILKDIYEPHKKKNALHFKAYFNYKVDTLYLSLAHLEGEKEMRGSEPLPFQGANVYYFLTALTGLPNVATNLRYIAFEADSCIPDWLAIGLTALSGLEQVSLVYGDQCCGNDLSGHRTAMTFLDVGPRNGHCSHLHKRTDELWQVMEDGIVTELEKMNKYSDHLDDSPLIDERDRTKLTVVPKMLVREW
jgi:hypothetical protein